MNLKYKNEKLKKIVENEGLFNSKFGVNTHQKYVKTRMFISTIRNIGDSNKYPSLKFEKKNGEANIGIFRISIKIRVEFTYDKNVDFLDVREITIIKIHQHKYKK